MKLGASTFQMVPTKPFRNDLAPFSSGFMWLAFIPLGKQQKEDHQQKVRLVHPWKLAWNLKITQLKRKIIFQTSILGFKMLIFQGVSVLMFLLMAHFLNPEVGGGMSPRCLGITGLPLEFSCWRRRAVRSKINCLWSCWVLVEDRNPSQESSAKNAMEPLVAWGSKKEAGARNQNFTHENQQMSPKWKGTILYKRNQLIFQCLLSWRVRFLNFIHLWAKFHDDQPPPVGNGHPKCSKQFMFRNC